MNVLITGCAGFLGTNLAMELLKNPNLNVIGIDNFLTGKKSHISILSTFNNFSFLEIDCRDASALKNLNLPRIDQIFHLAANSDIAAALKSPTIDYELGIQTTHSMLEFARFNRTKHFLFSSGSGVYGENLNEVFHETSFVGQPTSTYGATKLASEALISAYSYMFDMRATVFRFSNLVGPKMTHGVIFDFIQKLKADNSKLKVMGNGTQLKPYIHVSDAINGIMLAIENQDSLFGVYNVSNSSLTSVSSIANFVAKALHLTDVNFEFDESDRGWKADIPKYQMSSDKLIRLGWKLKFNSDEAIQLAIKENLIK